VTGLLIAGDLHDVAGLTIIPPASHGGPAWAALDPGDYRVRNTGWVRQLIVHTTGGNWPQPLRPGAGHPGHAAQIAEMWSGRDRGGGERVHSAAPLIVDFDGAVACLGDLAYHAAWHAEMSSPLSIGIEMSTLPDGSIYDATLKAAARLVDFLCWPTFPIPRQMPRGPYRGVPLKRMEVGTGETRHQLGGPSVVGVLGHRDNTSERGRGDPGDAIWGELASVGFEAVDYAGAEDLELGQRRQAALVARGENLQVDGVVGPASLAAMQRHGFSQWRDVA
jgi:hypothetical protein